MPFIPESPFDFTITAPVTRTVEYAEIIGFTFTDDPYEGPREGVPVSEKHPGRNGPHLHIRVSYGRVVDGSRKEDFVKVHRVDGAALATAMAATVSAGRSRYEDIKTALYAVLRAKNVLPSGQVQ